MTEFVDSKILIYCVDPRDSRREPARSVLQRAPSTSVQALNELVSVTRRKFGLTLQEARDASDSLQIILGSVHSLLLEDHQRATALATQHRLQWWDSLLIAVALRVGATRFFSEDMQHGQMLEGQLTIVNPFA